MSTHVVGIRTPTPEHQRMVAAWRANEAAGVEQPAKLFTYFNHEAPDQEGSLLVEIPKSAQKPYQGDSSAGIVVDLTNLPGGVTALRFYNSW